MSARSPTAMKLPLLLFSLLLGACNAAPESQRVELGSVEWTRDHDAALKRSKETGKPVFLLFQEVPG